MELSNIDADEFAKAISDISEDEFAKMFASILMEKVHEHDEVFSKALHMGCVSLCMKAKENGKLDPNDVMEAFGIDFLLEKFEKIASGEVKFSELNAKGEE